VRQNRVVARAALIAVLAAVAVPALAVSRPPSSASAFDPTAFSAVRVDGSPGPTMTLPRLPYPLDSYRDFATAPPNPAALAEPAARPSPSPPPRPTPSAAPVVVNRWHDDPNVSWYGPGFYGGRTACGIAYTTTTMGVANRTLPCGTRVTFRNPENGITITVPVIDRGPYVSGRQWDLSGALCLALDHCYTGELLWRLP
jgi:hypothetical protein